MNTITNWSSWKGVLDSVAASQEIEKRVLVGQQVGALGSVARSRLSAFACVEQPRPRRQHV